LSVPLHPSSERPASAGVLASLRLAGQPDEVIYAPFELHVRQLVSEPPGDLVLILERSCSRCRGAAFVPVTEARACSSCTASGVELVDGREQPCSVCEGSCAVPVEVMEQCERCDGTGLELTEVGRRLLRLEAAQLRAFLERWRDWRDRP